MPRAEEPHSKNDQAGKLLCDLGTMMGGRRREGGGGPAGFPVYGEAQKKELIAITTPTAAAAFPAREGVRKCLWGTADKPCAL